MTFFLSLWAIKPVKYFLIAFGTLLVIVSAFLFWLGAHDAGIKNALNNEWVVKIASAKPQIKIEYRDTKIPPAAPSTQKKTPKVVLESEHQRQLDSLRIYWESVDANKDSLIGYYTQITGATFDDSTETCFVTVYPLEPSDNIVLQKVPKEQTIKLPYVTETKLIPEPVPWYKSPTAYYCYGILTAGIVYAGVNATK
jgi:hypothetical protein